MFIVQAIGWSQWADFRMMSQVQGDQIGQFFANWATFGGSL